MSDWEYLVAAGIDDRRKSVRDRDRRYVNWRELCVCGHLDYAHSASIGGNHRVQPTRTQRARGEEFTVTEVFDGCKGAMPSRNFEREKGTVDREAMTLEVVIQPTCPCEKFRPVARVDRPRRFFNQRIHPTDRVFTRHPFAVGIRAYRKALLRLQEVDGDPDRLEEVWERRFTWTVDRVCAISKCKQTGVHVWPALVNDENLSELRCDFHRDR